MSYLLLNILLLNHLFDIRIDFDKYQWWGERPHVFTKGITNYADYKLQFENCGDAKAVGEASPLYLYREGVVEKIVFAESWRHIFEESSLTSFDDLYNFADGETINKNTKRKTAVVNTD